ncbi:auxin-responsive protein IAA3-like [Solanum verrucosum]|uniref:auxin-responsive protein IAA3-like n=1 Tax=Solanum verrucosum TaxID=315347 RepID=UPI0020D1AFAA|nr:auxin-responsive protein IAA3-like [Solanum verrucosum]
MERDLNLKASTELRLGLPGREEEFDHQQIVSNSKNNKRALSEYEDDESISHYEATTPHVTKVQIVGWPPVRSYNRKNTLQITSKKTEVHQDQCGIFVKVRMDGAPFLRKIDLKMYKCYTQLLKAMEKMFKLNKGEFAPTYEDKDGDLMLVGDVPWEMFMSSCKRLRIMKRSEARGLGSCGL